MPATAKPKHGSATKASVPRPWPREQEQALPIREDSAEEVAEAEDDNEYSEPSADRQGLLDYLDSLDRDGLRIREVSYVVNGWTLGGLLPLKHHGFILKIEENVYLTLDFSRRGILWDTFDCFPDLPDGTFFLKKYAVDVEPWKIRNYCEETKPFSWPNNDCAHWAKGVMRVMMIMEDPLEDRGAFRRPEKPGPAGYLKCGGKAKDPTAVFGCFS